MPIAIKDSKIDITSEKFTKELAQKFTKYLKGGEFIFLYGEMGVGKTTFVKYFINEYQKINNLTQTEITSPTLRYFVNSLANSLVNFSEVISIVLSLIAIGIWFERTFCSNAYIICLLF